MATPSELVHFHNAIQAALANADRADDIAELERLRTAVDDASRGRQLPEATRAHLLERFGEPEV
ncbi:hypothetical protein FOS14_09860 [Skermania sp. ID1734]|uniref:hypothetical protein n=1 Tax=Skermania sp. ID1734 TaxID=2597516 RepID=UPI00117CA0D2|nr:hypothetical protein [Skermania sp. ID1734]TSE00108.1 hypothetical protein FOS14_09860 [Skermania sp. ID1734]